jgi:hypothetical protein
MADYNAVIIFTTSKSSSSTLPVSRLNRVISVYFDPLLSSWLLFRLCSFALELTLGVLLLASQLLYNPMLFYVVYFLTS